MGRSKRHDKLQTALQYFSKICDVQNVPVGIITTTGTGKFVIRFSLSESVSPFDSFEFAAKKIYETYLKAVSEPL